MIKPSLILAIVIITAWGMGMGTGVAKEETHASPDHVLWYRQPATNWMTQALPIGNGRMAAMLFGGVPRDEIQFNEESLWIGDETNTGAYQAFGSVLVEMTQQGNPATYRRQLDIGDAVHTVTYESGGVTYRSETFASHPAGVIAVRYTADKPGMLSGKVSLTDAHGAAVVASGNRITSAGNLAGHHFHDAKREKVEIPYSIVLDYEAQVRVLHHGGTIRAEGDAIHFENADSITLLLDAGTDFLQDREKGWKGAPPHAKVTARLDAASKRTWATCWRSILRTTGRCSAGFPST